MPIYDVKCLRCGWKAQLPVEESVAITLSQMWCQVCLKRSGGKEFHRFKIDKHVAVGPFTKFFPAR